MVGNHGRGKPCHYHDTAWQADACVMAGMAGASPATTMTRLGEPTQS